MIKCPCEKRFKNKEQTDQGRIPTMLDVFVTEYESRINLNIKCSYNLKLFDITAKLPWVSLIYRSTYQCLDLRSPVVHTGQKVTFFIYPYSIIDHLSPVVFHLINICERVFFPSYVFWKQKPPKIFIYCYFRTYYTTRDDIWENANSLASDHVIVILLTYVRPWEANCLLRSLCNKEMEK